MRLCVYEGGLFSVTGFRLVSPNVMKNEEYYTPLLCNEELRPSCPHDGVVVTVHASCFEVERRKMCTGPWGLPVCCCAHQGVGRSMLSSCSFEKANRIFSELSDAAAVVAAACGWTT